MWIIQAFYMSGCVWSVTSVRTAVLSDSLLEPVFVFQSCSTLVLSLCLYLFFLLYKVLHPWTSPCIHHMLPVLHRVFWKLPPPLHYQNTGIADVTSPLFTSQLEAVISINLILLAAGEAGAGIVELVLVLLTFRKTSIAPRIYICNKFIAKGPQRASS